MDCSDRSCGGSAPDRVRSHSHSEDFGFGDGHFDGTSERRYEGKTVAWRSADAIQGRRVLRVALPRYQVGDVSCARRCLSGLGARQSLHCEQNCISHSSGDTPQESARRSCGYARLCWPRSSSFEIARTKPYLRPFSATCVPMGASRLAFIWSYVRRQIALDGRIVAVQPCCPITRCGVKRRESSVGSKPTRRLSLQPVATGAAEEVKSRPKPSATTGTRRAASSPSSARRAWPSTIPMTTPTA
jgi:hypothetical protein